VQVVLSADARDGAGQRRPARQHHAEAFALCRLVGGGGARRGPCDVVLVFPQLLAARWACELTWAQRRGTELLVALDPRAPANLLLLEPPPPPTGEGGAAPRRRGAGHPPREEEAHRARVGGGGGGGGGGAREAEEVQAVRQPSWAAVPCTWARAMGAAAHGGAQARAIVAEVLQPLLRVRAPRLSRAEVARINSWQSSSSAAAAAATPPTATTRRHHPPSSDAAESTAASASASVSRAVAERRDRRVASAGRRCAVLSEQVHIEVARASVLGRPDPALVAAQGEAQVSQTAALMMRRARHVPATAP
jgi:hypothetical protein